MIEADDPHRSGETCAPGIGAVVRVADDDELWDGELLGVEVDGVPVVLARVNGTVHGFVDRCAHLRVRLSEGRLDGAVLTCRAHHWRYDATSGCGINPRDARLQRVPVGTSDGGIFVGLDRADD